MKNWLCSCGRKNLITDFLCVFCQQPQPEQKAPKRIKKVSDKRQDETVIYLKLRKQFLLHKMACEVKLEGCTVTATEIHHCSMSALNYLNTDTWVSVCHGCHVVIETKLSAEQRREMGLLI